MRYIFNRQVAYIEQYKSIAFITAFLFLLTTGGLMRPSSSCLISVQTPRAIIDLELAFKQKRAEQVRNLWRNKPCTSSLFGEDTKLQATTENILLDFPFIVAYMCFMIVLLVITNQRTYASVTQLSFIYLVGLSGLLDAIENIGMLIYLHAIKIPSLSFAIPAALKFFILIGLAAVILFRVGKRLVKSMQ